MGWLDKYQDGGKLKAQNGKIIYGSPEYEKLYNEGSIAGKDADGNPTIALDEVTLTADKRTGKNILDDYPYYNELTEQDKKYFRDNSPIGTSIRRKAQTKKGLAEDALAIPGQLLQGAMESLQTPQSLMVEGLQAMEGKDHNFANALPGSNAQKTTSDAYGFETTNDMSWYNPKNISNFVLDVVTDPLDLVGVGYAGDALKIGKGINKLGTKYAPNVGKKIGFKQFEPNPNSYYRGAGEDAIKDALQSRVIRQNPKGPYSDEKLFATPSFKLADNQYAQSYSNASGGLKNIIEIPKKIGNFEKFDKYGLHVRGDKTIPVSDVNLYKQDWLRGYKQIETPKPKFKTEIEWSNWNKEIPDNSKLLKEYNTIEQQAKASGTWMKNPDGSVFKGTPEQFVQQNSENFKKAFPNPILDDAGNIQTNYHGSPNNFEVFSANRPLTEKTGTALGDGVYTSAKRSQALEYAVRNPDKKGNLYELYINSNKPQNKISLHEKYIDGKIGKIKKDLLDKKISNDKANKLYDDVLKENEDIWETIPNSEFKLQKDKDYLRVNNEQVTSRDNYLKSMKGNNGMFDMTNPNIYKSVVGGAVGTGAVAKTKNDGWLDEYEQGGIIKDNRGQWAHPGKVTKINSNNITMKGVNYPVLGVSNTGDEQLMMPGEDYKFDGESVTEYPMAQEGKEIKKYDWRARRQQTPGFTEDFNKDSFYDTLLTDTIRTKKGTEDQWDSLSGSIAYHESKGDPLAMQGDGGPGRGLYQFEPNSLKTAGKRALNYGKKNEVEIPEYIKNVAKGNITDATKLTPEQQKTLLLIDYRMKPNADIGKYFSGKQSAEDFWIQGHWGGEKEHGPAVTKKRRESFKRDFKEYQKLNTTKKSKQGGWLDKW